jgi:hypothetical protein
LTSKKNLKNFALYTITDELGLESAQKHWIRLRGYEKLQPVWDGIKFSDGVCESKQLARAEKVEVL